MTVFVSNSKNGVALLRPSGSLWLILGILASSLLGACQTTRKPAPVLPESLAAFFGTCSVDEGAATLKLFRGGELHATSELEWVAISRDQWVVQVLDSLGQSLLNLSRHGLEVEKTGPLSTQIPAVAATPHDQLLIDGSFVGLKASEIPCVLGGRLPYVWLSGLVDVTRQSQRSTLTILEDDRTIEVEAEILPEVAPRLCAKITWHQYLFLQHQLTWCLSDPGQRTGQVEGWNDYRLKWVRYQ